MLYKDFLIERPKNTKIIGKKGENRYIYHVTGKVYNKKTKFADDKKRICIGYGHAKVDEGLPQVNVSYVVKQENCRPLFYEVYPGSIVDNVEFEYMIQKAEEYGYENIGVILDRGYYSKRNIDALRKHGFIMMVKTNNEMIQKCINKHMIQLKNLNGYLKEHLLSCASEHIKLFKGDKEKTYVHIYYDDIRAAEERKICELGIIKMEEELERLVEKKITTKDKTARYEKLFDLEYDTNGYLRSYKRNVKSVKAAKEKLGFFSIISDSESKAEEVIEIYRNRDQIEKMFMMVKSGFDMNKFGVQSDAVMNSKIYLAFIGSIVRSEINQRLKALRETNRKEYTVPSALNALENIEVTRNTKGTYIRRYALTVKQKKIFNLFGIDEKMINEEVAKLNKMYK